MKKLKMDLFFRTSQENSFLLENPTLTILDVYEEEILANGRKITPRDNEIFLSVANGYADRKIETTFDVIIPYHDLENYIYTKSTIKYITIRRGDDVDFIPKGYSAVCLFEFPHGKPDILNKLSIYRERFDPSKHDFLIFTQKCVLDEILKKLSSSEIA